MTKKKSFAVLVVKRLFAPKTFPIVSLMMTTIPQRWPRQERSSVLFFSKLCGVYDRIN